METAILLQTSESGLRSLIREELSQVLADLRPKEKRYYNRKQLCELFKVSLPTVHTWINNGVLECSKIGGRTLFDVDKIDALIGVNKVVKYRHGKGGSK